MTTYTPPPEPGQPPEAVRHDTPVTLVGAKETAVSSVMYHSVQQRGGEMHYEKTAVVAAAPERVWEVLTDVERWPEQIAVYEHVERLDEGPLQVGSRAKVKQEKLATGVWRVTELVPGESFVWTSRQPGVRLTGRHTVTAEPHGDARLTLVFEQSGPLSWMVSLLLGRLVRRYVDAESAALVAVAESVEA
jgi:uncharacterized membrane protein